VKGLDETFARTVAVLEAAEVPYMVVGSVASAFHGMARSTQDLDLVVELGADLDQGLGAKFMQRIDAAVDKIRAAPHRHRSGVPALASIG
jgi:hypothetical protein